MRLVISILWHATIPVALALLASLVIATVSGGSVASVYVTLGYILGCVVLLMAFAGHSITFRVGTLDPWLTSFFVRLLPQLSRRYENVPLHASVRLSLVGISLLVSAAILDSL